jgi:drug/metabolite transporter (DMT)-like permease
MYRTLSLVAIVVVFGLGGQLCLRRGMSQVGEIGLDDVKHLPQILVRTFSNPFVLLGSLLVVVGSLFWLVTLSGAQLSYALPMLALGYLLLPFASWFVLQEQVSPLRWLGTILIVVGVVLVSKS